MRPENHRKRKNRLNQAVEDVLNRLREELDNIAGGLRPASPQPVPIPIPTRQPRKR